MFSNDRYIGQLNSKIIAVDYDDTITKHVPYPQTAPLNPLAKKYLDKLHEKGYTLVLWSSRLSYHYIEAYNRCVNEFGLYYIEKDDPYKYVHGVTGKILARFYIDDKSIPGRFSWRRLYRYIVKNIK